MRQKPGYLKLLLTFDFKKISGFLSALKLVVFAVPIVPGELQRLEKFIIKTGVIFICKPHQSNRLLKPLHGSNDCGSSVGASEGIIILDYCFNMHTLNPLQVSETLRAWICLNYSVFLKLS